MLDTDPLPLKQNEQTVQLKKPRILILSWELLPVYAGGLGILCRDVVKELEEQGCEVTVLLPRIPKGVVIPNGITMDKQYRKYFKENLPLDELNYSFDLHDSKGVMLKSLWPKLFTKSAKKESGFTLYPNNMPRHVRAYGRICKDFVEKDPNWDLIIGMDWMSTIPFHFIKELDLSIPFYFYVNSVEQDRAPNPQRISEGHISNKYLESTFFKQAEKVIAISSITKSQLMEHCDVPEKNIITVLNDITFKPKNKGYKELNKGKNVLFIGRVEVQKGLNFLLDTAEKVVSIDSQVRFLIAGDGQDMDETVESIAERGLEKNCIIIGWVNNDQKKQLYKSADLFVMTSPSEPFGLTPIESIMSKVPVISSEKCGFLDVLPSTPTYEFYDTNRFTEILLHYLNNPEERKELLKKQLEDYEDHTWSKQVRKILTSLDQEK